MFIRNKQYPQYFDIQNSLLSTDTEFWVTNVSFSSMSTACLTIKRLEITKEKTISIGKQHIKYSKNVPLLLQLEIHFVLQCFFNNSKEFELRNYRSIIGEIRKQNRALWTNIKLDKCIDERMHLIRLYMQLLNLKTNWQRVNSKCNNNIQFQVYQVRSKIDDINYAIKVFDKAQLETDNQVKQSLLFEIQYLKLFNHPNIVKYLGVFESKSQIILIQELLLGGDLDSNIQERKLDEDQIKIIMKSILGGLDYMHSFGIFHRDIKKCNIMLRQQNNYESLCLIDFGLAEKANSENNYLFRYCGTPGCVAPEILRKQQYGLKVDIYSVGILGYQLMFGKDPFKSNTTKEIIVKNFLGHIDFSDTSSISKSGIYFLKGLIEIDPQIRFSAAQALKHPFLQPEINKILVNGNRFNVHIRKEPLKLKPLLFHNSRNQSPNNVSKTSPSKFHLKTDMSPKSDREKSNIDSSRLISKSFFQRNYKKMNTK